MLHIDVCHHHAPLKRARAIQSRSRDDVAETVGFHFGQQVAHPAAFQLKDSFCFATLQQGVSLSIVEGKINRLNRNAAVFLHVLDRFVENGQVAKAKEIHLQQTDVFDRGAVPLRNDVGFAGNGL